MGTERVQHQRGVGGLRPRRPSRSRCRELRAVDACRPTSIARLDGKTKSYCTPESYKGASLRLWHNRGNGTFEDTTQKAGSVRLRRRRAWGSRFSTPIRMAGQTSLSATTRNRTSSTSITGNGTFTEKGVPAGIAYSEDGVARAGMGVDAADYDRSGYPSLLITNFSNQMIALYHNERNGLFVDEAPQSDVGAPDAADAWLRLLFLRLRSGRLARHLRRRWPLEDADRADPAPRALCRAAASLPQSRQRQICGRDGRLGPAFARRAWRAAPLTATSTTTARST